MLDQSRPPLPRVDPACFTRACHRRLSASCADASPGFLVIYPALLRPPLVPAHKTEPRLKCRPGPLSASCAEFRYSNTLGVLRPAGFAPCQGRQPRIRHPTHVQIRCPPTGPCGLRTARGSPLRFWWCPATRELRTRYRAHDHAEPEFWSWRRLLGPPWCPPLGVDDARPDPAVRLPPSCPLWSLAALWWLCAIARPRVPRRPRPGAVLALILMPAFGRVTLRAVPNPTATVAVGVAVGVAVHTLPATTGLPSGSSAGVSSAGPVPCLQAHKAVVSVFLWP